ncbi:porin family protein [Proteiniphilum sp. X52]|uniref:porin family protein n=1 Tax=Proteiniphilum sp. X52 TaxID=2382159 RepID=UPI000F0A88D0|nr:porin family protein [Proteiniphilum sp. X52]RNC63516.1 PorT family protein [Proteiniphilum sp. X52]
MRKVKFSLIAAMLIMVTAASAQVNLGIKGGVNMSNFYGDELNDKNAKIGFHIGLAADYEFMYNSAIQTGLFFTTKGAKYQGSLGSVSGEISVNPMYLQLPVHYAYKLDVSPGTRIVFHAGPYAAYGVGGKTKFKVSAGSGSAERDGENVFGKDKLLKPFDAGLGLGVGAEFGQILFDLGWDMGLVNISNVSNGNIKNQNAYLSVGYKF